MIEGPHFIFTGVIDLADISNLYEVFFGLCLCIHNYVLGVVFAYSHEVYHNT